MAGVDAGRAWRTGASLEALAREFSPRVQVHRRHLVSLDIARAWPAAGHAGRDRRMNCGARRRTGGCIPRSRMAPTRTAALLLALASSNWRGRRPLDKLGRLDQLGRRKSDEAGASWCRRRNATRWRRCRSACCASCPATGFRSRLRGCRARRLVTRIAAVPGSGRSAESYPAAALGPEDAGRPGRAARRARCRSGWGSPA